MGSVVKSYSPKNWIGQQTREKPVNVKCSGRQRRHDRKTGRERKREGEREREGVCVGGGERESEKQKERGYGICSS